MCLVGNGFDTAVFCKYDSGIHWKKSSYNDFYDYITFKGLLNISTKGNKAGQLTNELESNVIYNKMKEDKKEYENKLREYEEAKEKAQQAGESFLVSEPELNWCDFEKCIDDLVFNKTTRTQYIDKYEDKLVYIKDEKDPIKTTNNREQAYYEKLNDDLSVLRDNFSRFINELLSSDTIIKVNKEAKEHQWAYKSLQGFLEDLKDSVGIEKMEFPHKLDNAHLFNYTFFCFNYTMLLDNYLCLDQEQFDPHVYKTVDTNFVFNADPDYMFNTVDKPNIDPYNKDRFISVYLLSNIIHPHGIKDVPRSMLFGTENSKFRETKYNKHFIKSYWGQNNRKYLNDFQDTELFIIYGMSLGSSDGWWMGNIYKRLLGTDNENKAELIIYSLKPDDYNDDNKNLYTEKIKNKFCKACVFYEIDDKTHNKHLDISLNRDKRDEEVKSRIYVAFITKDNNNCFLGFNETTKPQYIF
jgi:hypothetical protein